MKNSLTSINLDCLECWEIYFDAAISYSSVVALVVNKSEVPEIIDRPVWISLNDTSLCRFLGYIYIYIFGSSVYTFCLKMKLLWFRLIGSL